MPAILSHITTPAHKLASSGSGRGLVPWHTYLAVALARDRACRARAGRVATGIGGDVGALAKAVEEIEERNAIARACVESRDLSRTRYACGRAAGSEAPIVNGDGAAVACVQVVLGQFEIGLGHLLGAATEQGLQDVAIATVVQESDGERVAKAIGVGVEDAGTAA